MFRSTIEFWNILKIINCYILNKTIIINIVFVIYNKNY